MKDGEISLDGQGKPQVAYKLGAAYSQLSIDDAIFLRSRLSLSDKMYKTLSQDIDTMEAIEEGQD